MMAHKNEEVNNNNLENKNKALNKNNSERGLQSQYDPNRRKQEWGIVQGLKSEWGSELNTRKLV